VKPFFRGLKPEEKTSEEKKSETFDPKSPPFA
jgi:hypothetical protein